MIQNVNIIVGNVVTTPEFKYVGEEVAMCKFRLAQTDRRRDANGDWHDGGSTYITVVCWRNLAQNAVQSIARDDSVIVVGKTSFREWEVEGHRRSVLEIEAHTVGPDLNRHVAPVKRTRRTLAETAAQQAQDSAFDAVVAGALASPDVTDEDVDDDEFSELEVVGAASA